MKNNYIFIYGAHVYRDNIFGCFLHFFQIKIFMVNSGLKGQNMAQNDKKLCLSHCVSQEAYIISPDAFFNFSEFSCFLFYFLGC